MKLLLTIAVTSLMAVSAKASFFQEYCSIANSEVKTSFGHLSNDIEVIQTEVKNGKLEKKMITLQPNEIHVEVVKEVLLEEVHNSGSCEDGDIGSIYSSDRYFYRSVIWSMESGESFPEGFPGLSTDKKSMKVKLLCQMHVNGLRTCN